MKVMIVKEVMTGDVSPVAMFKLDQLKQLRLLDLKYKMSLLNNIFAPQEVLNLKCLRIFIRDKDTFDK